MKLSGDVAILRLQHGKANAIDIGLLDKLDRFLDDCDVFGAKAAVLTGYDRYFSAGLALPSLIAHDRDQMRDFMTRFAATMMRLYASPFPLIAAVNGHAIAGGCVIALMADRRFMVNEDDCKIGLNEIRLGIGLPPCVLEPLRALVPASVLPAIALEGRLFTPEQARGIKLVDEVAVRDELETRAVKLAQMLATLNQVGWSQIKLAIRRPVIEAAQRFADEEMEKWLDSWFSTDARHKLVELVGKLTPGSA